MDACFARADPPDTPDPNLRTRETVLDCDSSFTDGAEEVEDLFWKWVERPKK